MSIRYHVANVDGNTGWSVAEVVEHLAVLEDLFVNNLCAQLRTAPAGRPDTDVKNVDAIIFWHVHDAHALAAR